MNHTFAGELLDPGRNDSDSLNPPANPSSDWIGDSANDQMTF